MAGLSQITSQSYAIQLDSNVFNHLGDGGYESPILTDGEHAITYSTGDLSLFPVFDYLTIVAGAQTAMRGRNVIVDDQNTETAIDFVGGGWSTATLRFENVFDHGKGPYNDTIHWVSEANNSLSFAFTGIHSQQSLISFQLTKFSNRLIGISICCTPPDHGWSYVTHLRIGWQFRRNKCRCKHR